MSLCFVPDEHAGSKCSTNEDCGVDHGEHFTHSPNEIVLIYLKRSFFIP